MAAVLEGGTISSSVRVKDVLVRKAQRSALGRYRDLFLRHPNLNELKRLEASTTSSTSFATANRGT